MKNEIIFYKKNGEVDTIEMLNNKNLEHINGMMTRCVLNDGTVEVGFADSFRTHDSYSFDDSVHDYIYLWIWENLDEKTHRLFGDNKNKFNQIFKKVDIIDIVEVEVILYSNPRFGGVLTNEFYLGKA